ncbi:MAG: hypothetical protein Q8916_03470 [Bacteroidota bacterium]|nr:hypothetical protein [Bacteroidota bacterium]MDP4229448.1 hypothetical protein [Bacteroidota bacterium]MDP4235399.1 hypothetical protein [Bacteroidota bacterium]
MFRFLKGLIFFAIFLFLFGFISMSLWNALIPDLFHGPVLTYWQALGLLFLSKIFFGGFHGGHKRHCHGRNRHWGKYWNAGNWQGWEEKFMKMTPEEREAWKRNIKNEWCYPGPEKNSESSQSAAS